MVFNTAKCLYFSGFVAILFFHVPADIFSDRCLKFLSLKIAPKLMLGCIVSNCGTQAILRVQIDTILKWGLSFLHLLQMP